MKGSEANVKKIMGHFWDVLDEFFFFPSLLILMIKILNSIRRRNEVGDAPSEDNIWSMSFTFGTQMKMILCLFFLYLVAGAYTEAKSTSTELTINCKNLTF